MLECINKWNKFNIRSTANLFEKVVAFGGEISGEHGVGTHNKYYFEEFTAKQNLHIMKGIKKVFDPNNILNTNNIFFNN